MRRFAPLLALPFLLSVGPLHAHSAPARTATPTAGHTPADSLPLTARWNRLVPGVVEADVASRRRARAAAAGDSAALARLRRSRPPLLLSVYTTLSVAQYTAVQSALEARDVSTAAAVASAAAGVLAGLYPDSAARALIARELDRDLANAQRGAGGSVQRVQAGSALGEAIAARLLAEAPPLDIAAPWTGTIPVGPGRWFSEPGVPPLGIRFATARPWLLDSTAQFRPAAPPAYGSARWRAAMDEVRAVAKTRTPGQTAIAQTWDGMDPWAVWNEIAVAAIRRRQLSDADAARVLVVMNASATDAMLACFEAKYHYWTIRPSQADPTLSLAADVSPPNFPSFPSGHACSAGAFDAALAHFFPADTVAFNMVAKEQAMSRLYGGVHYRFDNDVGLALGRTVARYAIQREQRGGLRGWRPSGARQRQ